MYTLGGLIIAAFAPLVAFPLGAFVALAGLGLRYRWGAGSLMSIPLVAAGVATCLLAVGGMFLTPSYERSVVLPAQPIHHCAPAQVHGC